MDVETTETTVQKATMDVETTETNVDKLSILNNTLPPFKNLPPLNDELVLASAKADISDVSAKAQTLVVENLESKISNNESSTNQNFDKPLHHLI